MKEIDIVSPTGIRGTVPESEAENALSQGARLITPEEKKQEEDAVKYGNQTAKAILYSGARGLSLGLSDQLLSKTGIVDQEELKGIKDFNEGASIAGEIAGAALPTFFTGGTSLAARAALATPAGIATRLAARSGSKVAETVAKNIVGNGLKQTIVKKAAELGTMGLVEGAIFGEAQLVTEEALGDAEFNAESILGSAGIGAIAGFGTGAALGAMGAVGERALKKISGFQQKRLLKNRTDIPDTEKAIIEKAIDSEDAMLKNINLAEKTGVKEAAERLGVTPTQGTLSAEPMIGKLESSIAGGSSIGPSATLRLERETLEEGLQDATKKVIEGAASSRYDAGDAIKIGLRDQMVADLGEAPTVFSANLTSFGKVAPNEKIMKLIPSRIRKTDSYKSLLKPEKAQVEELMGMLQRSENIIQVNNIKKAIGQRMAQANRDGNRLLADGLGDLYRTAGRAEEDAIELAANLSFGKDKKAISDWMNGWKEAKQTYSSFYDKYKGFAKEIGIKAKGAQGIIDQLSDVKPETLAKKFFDINDFNKAEKMASEFPEAFDVARRQRLSEILNSTRKQDGSYNLQTFVRKLERLDETQKKILISPKYKKTLEDIQTVVNALPPNINPSGTDFANAWRSILSPIYQATEYARYALYKGGSKSLRGYFNKGLPAMAAAEQAQNLANKKISSSVKGYFSPMRSGLSYGQADQLSEDQIKRARKVLDMIQTEPEAFIEEMTRKNKDFQSYMPNTNNALQARMIAATQFLSSKAPKRQDFVMNDDYEAPNSEVKRFNDYLFAVEKPFKAIEQLKSGYINPRAIEAIKVVYPKTFQKLQQQISENLPKKLTPQQRNQVSLILGAKVSPLFTKNAMALLQGQANQQQQPEAPTKKVPVSASKEMNSAGRSQGGFDAVVNRRV